jgi:nucleotide-binding universal stress UspA family protein
VIHRFSQVGNHGYLYPSVFERDEDYAHPITLTDPDERHAMTERRILVPVDGSEQSTAGLRYALEEYEDAEFVALHVLPPVAWDPDDPPPPDELLHQWQEQRRTEANRVLEEAASVGAEHGVDVETVLETGEPWRAIVDYADDAGIKHIVMGSRGQTDSPAVPLGSVAETVVRRAHAVVSVVR